MLASHNNFRLKFRTRRDPHQSIAIPKTAIKIVKNYEVRMYSNLTRKQIFRPKESLPVEKIDFDTRILYNNGKWYRCVPYEMPKARENQARGGIISLNPGVRTFQTGYSPDAVVYNFGEKDFQRVYRLILAIHRLTSKLCTKKVNCPTTTRREERRVIVYEKLFNAYKEQSRI